jgi:signal transduction histidine kinase
LINLARESRSQNRFESGLKAYLKALSTLQEQKQDGMVLELQVEIGDFYRENKNYSQAIYFYLEALKSLAKTSNLEKIQDLHQKLAHSYMDFKKFSEATNYLKKTLEYHNRKQNLTAIVQNLKMLVDAQTELGNFENVKQYNERILRVLRRIGDSCAVANALNNYAFSLNQLKDYTSALEQFRNSYQLMSLCNFDTLSRVKVLINMGINYQNLGDPYALKVFKQAKNLASAAKLVNQTLEIDLILASVELQEGNLGTAEHLCRKVLAAAILTNSKPQIKQAYLLLSEVQQATGDFKSALESYKRYLQTQDTTKEIQTQAIEESQYTQKELKDREIQLLLETEKRIEVELLNKNLLLNYQEQQINNLKNQELLAQAAIQQRDLQQAKLRNELQLESDKYLAAKRERELQELKKEELLRKAELESERKNRALRALEFEKLQASKQAAEKEAEAQQLWAIIGIIAFLVTLTFFVILLVFYFRDKRKNYQIAQTVAMLRDKNLEIEAKNRETTLINSKMSRKNLELELKKDEIEKQKTRIEEAYEVLKKTQTQLVQAAKMASLGQLTAGIAHEINNPINFVSANINPLKKDLKDLKDLLLEVKKAQKSSVELQKLYFQYDIDYLLEEIEQLTVGIEEGALRTKEIVLGLRNFSRLDEDNFKQADLNEGINSTLSLLKSVTRNRVEIHKDLAELPPVECLPGKLNQVFMNLITNAIQSIKERGDVYVSTRLQNETVEIKVRDTGIGMDAQTVDRIFEPFFTTKDVGQGTGLGLSISYGIIERHNGSIKVESQPGKGSEFTIRIPIRQNLNPENKSQI